MHGMTPTDGKKRSLKAAFKRLLPWLKPYRNKLLLAAGLAVLSSASGIIGPKVLLFDDSFSALDYRTDLMLRQALRREMGDTTVLIVAQRIATVMKADKIIVLEQGRIVGEGRHEELLRTCDSYREIAQSQLSAEELKGGVA